MFSIWSAYHTHACGCRDEAKQCMNIRWMILCHIFGLCSAYSSSARSQIIATVYLKYTFFVYHLTLLFEQAPNSHWHYFVDLPTIAETQLGDKLSSTALDGAHFQQVYKLFKAGREAANSLDSRALSAGPLAHSLIYSLSRWLAHSPTHSLIRFPDHLITYVTTHSLIHSMVHSLTGPLAHWLIHSRTCSLTHSLTNAFTHSLPQSPNCLLTHSFTHLLTDSLTHQRIHSFTSPII